MLERGEDRKPGRRAASYACSWVSSPPTLPCIEGARAVHRAVAGDVGEAVRRPARDRSSSARRSGGANSAGRRARAPQAVLDTVPSRAKDIGSRGTTAPLSAHYDLRGSRGRTEPMRSPLSILAALALARSRRRRPRTALRKCSSKSSPCRSPGSPAPATGTGAGAALEAEYRISGTEYGGFPPPLDRRALLSPRGHQASPRRLSHMFRRDGRWSKGNRRGALPGRMPARPGTVQGIVAFGGTRVPEEASLESFFAPGGGLEFFTSGHDPVSLEIPSTATYENIAGAGGSGPSAHLTGAARRNGPRRPGRVGREDHRHGRCRDPRPRPGRSTTGRSPRAARRRGSRSGRR